MSKPFKSKFTQDETNSIVSLYASYVSVGDIIKHVKEKFDKTVTYSGILSIVKAKKNQELFNAMREKYLQRLWDSDIANKRFRLDALSNLFKANKDNPKRHHVALRALQLSREEMEDKAQKINLYQVTSTQDLKDGELITRYQKLIKELGTPKDGRTDPSERGDRPPDKGK